MSISDATAVISLMVAALSALYARWACSEAKKANQINLHNHQKQIYDAFFELKMHMTQEWDGIEISGVSKFYYPSKNAVFYFEKKLAEDIAKYFNICFEIADKNRRQLTDDELLNLMKKASEANELAILVESKLIKAVTVS